MPQAATTSRNCAFPQMLIYCLGEGANSLVMNGVFGFAMIFFTKALGLNPAWAGFAMAVSVVWEAIFEPIVGHVSDNSRSRWGRRHPYMLVGGAIMAVCSYLIWYVPAAFRANQIATMGYIIAINLILRTGLTMFFIPYMALGFEICWDYQGRARIQSLRQILNMAANFAGPALAWSIFFQDSGNVRGTSVSENYLHMGAAFAISTATFVLIVVVATFRWREDPRHLVRETSARWVKGFVVDMKQVFRDPNPRWVFVFVFVVCAGMVLVSSLQIFVYDDYMRFSAYEKSLAHGSTMLGMALGAFVSIGLSKRYDKRNTVLLGGTISVFANLLLALLFVSGWVPREATWRVGACAVPISLILFVALHATYWLGNGIMLPIANSMMADVSELHYLRSGIKKDGAYASVFSLSMRMAISLSLMASGCFLDLIGYKVPANGEVAKQSPGAVWGLGAITFVFGALICVISLLAIRKYPLTRREIEQARARRAGTALVAQS